MGKTTEEAIMYELRGIKDRTTRLYSLCRNVSILEEKEKELQAAREKIKELEARTKELSLNRPYDI